MERSNRKHSTSCSMLTTSKRRRNDPINLKTSITKFEDLSNELFYEIFDYLDDVESFMIFLPLNKRFSSLLLDSSRPLKFDLTNVSESLMNSCYGDIIITQRHRIRFMKLGDEQIDTVLSTYCIYSSFRLLESVTLDSISIGSGRKLPGLAELPCLSRLSITFEITQDERESIVDMYPILLTFKSLKCLAFHVDIDTSDDGSEEIDYYITDEYSIDDDSIDDDCIDASRFVAINQEPSNLEKLHIEHQIDTEGFLKIINQTPQLGYLFVQSLKRSDIYSQNMSIIPKLPKLTELIIEDSEFSCTCLELLLDAFDCQLEMLEIGIHSFADDQKWRQFMKTRLYGLETFIIRLEYEYYSGMVFNRSGGIPDSFNFMRFISDPFWYDHGWVAEMRINEGTVEAVFHLTKSVETLENHQSENQLKKSIHFNDEPYQMDSTFIGSSYSLSIDLDNPFDFKSFEDLGDTISYLPIKQLIIEGLSGPSITELLMILKQCPNLTFLSVQSAQASHIGDDNENQNMNDEYRFNNIHRLEINAAIERKWVTCLMKYLPKVNNVHVYCDLEGSNYLSVLGPFPSWNPQPMDYIQSLTRDMKIITIEFISNFYSDAEWKKLFNFLDEE